MSILPTLSKVFERLVLHQLIINEEALLGPTISGFHKGHSTTSVLLGIRDALIRASNRGEVTLMVCADYSKAFDTVQFKSVLIKMHNLGFSKEFLLWMVDYLTGRRQMVQIDDRKSDMATVEFGVPQGSILGLIFLISTLLISRRNYSVIVISTLTIRLSMSTRSPATWTPQQLK